MIYLATGLTMVAAAWFGVRGARRLGAGLRDAVSLDVIRGIRALVTALALTATAIGLLTGEPGFLVLAAVFLAEELYETGCVALIIRAGERSG